MKKNFRWVLYFALFVLYLLHNDFWFWHTPRLVLGLPVGLLYHIGFCVAVTLVMTLLVNRALPRHLEAKDDEESERQNQYP